jgi:outer membrane protein assembly factor BamB
MRLPLYLLKWLCPLVMLSACAQHTDLTPKLWSVHIEGVFNSVVDGNLMVGYLAGINDQVIAVDLPTHEILWQSAKGISTNYELALAINQEAVFVYLSGKGLHVYSRTGELLSQQPALPKGEGQEISQVTASLVLFGSTLLLPLDTQLYAYDVSAPSNPTLLWQHAFPQPVFALAADSEGVYVGGVASDPGNGLVKLSLNDGREVWRGDVKFFGQYAPLTQAVAVIGEQIIVYIIDTNGSLQSFDRNTGERLWVNPLQSCSDGAGWVDDMEVGGGNIYVSPSSGSCLFAVDLATGKEAWTLETRDGPDGAISIGGKPLYHKGVLYTSVERLWAVDAETGKVLSYAREPAYNTTGTILHYAGGQILVWGDDLTAYKPVRD